MRSSYPFQALQLLSSLLIEVTHGDLFQLVSMSDQEYAVSYADAHLLVLRTQLSGYAALHRNSDDHDCQVHHYHWALKPAKCHSARVDVIASAMRAKCLWSAWAETADLGSNESTGERAHRYRTRFQLPIDMTMTLKYAFFNSDTYTIII